MPQIRTCNTGQILGIFLKKMLTIFCLHKLTQAYTGLHKLISRYIVIRLLIGAIKAAVNKKEPAC